MNPKDYLGRRDFLRLTTVSVAAGLLASASLANAAKRPKIKAIAFDAFPIFDPSPLFDLAEEFFPGRGMELSNEWRTRQFEYTWLRTVSGSYVDFWHVTQDALHYAAKKVKVGMSQQQVSQLMDGYFNGIPGFRLSRRRTSVYGPICATRNMKSMWRAGGRGLLPQQSQTSSFADGGFSEAKVLQPLCRMPFLDSGGLDT